MDVGREGLRCGCRQHHPRSGGIFVLVQEPAEPVVSADAQLGERGGIGDRFGQRLQRSGVPDTPVRAVPVVVPFVFSQGVQQMRLVPDQRTVEQFRGGMLGSTVP